MRDRYRICLAERQASPRVNIKALPEGDECIAESMVIEEY